jgi:hypothetical protein
MAAGCRRAQLDELRSDDIIERDQDVYRASTIALYSTYQLRAPPIRPLTNEWDDPLTLGGNPADI